MGFPLPIVFQNIGGVVFTDIGGAWFDDDFKATEPNEFGQKVFRDMRVGYGFGARINIGYGTVLRLDVAWNHNYIKSSKPKYYISMGYNW